MTTFPLERSATDRSSASQNDTKPAAGTVPKDPLANKEVFLQLLVAQLRNQNPLDPADGIQFISQLAQFTGLEQSLAMREDLAAIRKALEKTGATTTQDGAPPRT
ncbi:MAG: hypothetical protein K2X35_01970 [Bryobacteraceae bacterium]|nr:hypothetical protein [Bryobacteraceae bacterium]